MVNNSFDKRETGVHSLNNTIEKEAKAIGTMLTKNTTSDSSIPQQFAKSGSLIVKDIQEIQKAKAKSLQTKESAENTTKTHKSIEKDSKSIDVSLQSDKLVDAIEKNPALEDPKNKNIVEKFKEALQSGDISGALQSLFDFLKGVMGPSSDPESTFWFKDNKEIQEFLSRLGENIDNLSIEDLEFEKNKFLTKIENTPGVKKRLGLTYALSRLLDEIVLKKDPNKQRLKGSSDGYSGKKSNKIAIARMAQSVQPGDVLAINKSEQKIGDKLLTQLSSDDLDTSHVLIVTSVNTTTGDITVAHSTQSKFNGTGGGVETNVSFADYTNQFNSIAIATLRPPQGSAEELVKNVLAKEGSEYDNRAAISTGATGINLTAKNGKYNCVELIAESFPDTVAKQWKDRTHPSQMLNIMKPAYVTIAGKSLGGS